MSLLYEIGVIKPNNGLFPETKSFPCSFVMLEGSCDGDFEIEEAANVPQEISLALTNGETVIDVGQDFPGNDVKIRFWGGVHIKF